MPYVQNNFKNYQLGEKESGIRSRNVVQDYHELRTQLLTSKKLFEDPEFPASSASTYFSKPPPKTFEWKRPHEISKDPKFFVEEASRFDIEQGELGNCWLLAAMTNLTLNPVLVSQVVPDDQGFGDKYAGIFHFRFWQYGRWVEVVVDDRLPTRKGKLVFLRSSEQNEYWSALLEKAYAKLHGSYEALAGGATAEGMVDFTGGVSETFRMSKAPPNLYQIMAQAYERSSLMGCSIEADPRETEAQTRDGLVKGHAYSITCIKYMDVQTSKKTGRIPMIRLRNPWGNETEWRGAWGDKSPEWTAISESEKKKIGLTFEHDGEFWMSFQDFKSHFTDLDICNLKCDALTGKTNWEMSMFEGAWVRGATAGGCNKFPETFWHNPQYNITLTDPDKNDDDRNCTAIVALMQKNRRSQRKMGVEDLSIGFVVYQLPNTGALPKPLDPRFFNLKSPVARSGPFINLREVCARFQLPPGTYCIVPSTYAANEEGEFIVRVFSETKNNMKENDEELGFTDPAGTKKPEKTVTKEDDKVTKFYRGIAGEDMEVDWMELKEVLDYAMRTETKSEGFSKDICRNMVSIMDADRSGKLEIHEFQVLWADIRKLKEAFTLFDTNKSMSLCAFEIRQALKAAGFKLNNQILNILANRYTNKGGVIAFDDFVMCAIRLKSLIGIFCERKSKSTNTATFTLEEWVEAALYSC